MRASARRQTPHVWAPGVSSYETATPRARSHSENRRLIASRKSSVPVVIETRRTRSRDAALTSGNSSSNLPAYMIRAPLIETTQPNRSGWFRPM